MELFKAEISASFNLSCGDINLPDSSPIIIGAFRRLLFRASFALKDRNSSAMIETAMRKAGSLIFVIQTSCFDEAFCFSPTETLRQAEIKMR